MRKFLPDLGPVYFLTLRGSSYRHLAFNYGFCQKRFASGVELKNNETLNIFKPLLVDFIIFIFYTFIEPVVNLHKENLCFLYIKIQFIGKVENVT